MLTNADRCDRCRMQAFYAVFLKAGELMFCAHHGREYMTALKLVAEEIFDGTDQLTAKPKAKSKV